MQHFYMIVVGSSLILVAGCHQAQEPPAKGQRSQAEASARKNGTDSSAVTANLTERDAEIIGYVLAEYDERPGDRIYFLTSTPMDDWGANGNWSDLPQSFHNSVASLKTTYRPAHEAYLKEDCVLEKGTNAEAWMRWITIKRWISDTEVEIEDGVWCCPLGGGASTTTYEKIDGEWQIKSNGEGWVS